MQIRKWYFVFNENGILHYDDMIRTAVRSCLQNTTLSPHCLYYGADHPFLEELRGMGVNVINHEVSLLKAIEATPDTPRWSAKIATGAYLRIDIPIIEQEDEFVLYTDVDVIFLKDIDYTGEPPRYFACAPEDDIDNWGFFNSGAMIINVPNFREVHAKLLEYCTPRLSKFIEKGQGTYDQGALNDYFANDWSRLPLEYNWKPYWGINEDAAIIHFHGPKPKFIQKIIANDSADIPPIYVKIYNKNPASCVYYFNKYIELEGGSRFEGHLDYVNENGKVVGWVRSISESAPVVIEISANGQHLGETAANQLRKDLAAAKKHEGFHGFEFTLPAEFKGAEPVAVHVTIKETGEELRGSPKPW